MALRVSRPGSNYGWRISRREAVRLLKQCEYDLPISLIGKEYGDDGDWVGLDYTDLHMSYSNRGALNYGKLDSDYRTIEIDADDNKYIAEDR